MGFWGKSDEDTQKELDEIKAKAAKADDLAAKLEAAEAEATAQAGELAAMKARMAALELSRQEPREQRMNAPAEPPRWDEDADAAFNARVKPIVAQTQRASEAVARQLAQNQLTSGEDGKFFAEFLNKFGNEVESLFATMPPEARMNPESFKNCVHVIQGRRQKQAFEIHEKLRSAKTGFEDGATNRGAPPDPENQLTAEEEAYCNKSGFSDAQKKEFLKNVRTKMQFSGVA